MYVVSWSSDRENGKIKRHSTLRPFPASVSDSSEGLSAEKTSEAVKVLVAEVHDAEIKQQLWG